MSATAARDDIESFLDTVREAELSVLLLDYDGTLAPFSVDRRFAVPYPGVRPLLQAIVDGGRTRLVIITGRTATDIAPLLGIHPNPEVWGSAGLQRLRPNGNREMVKVASDAIQGFTNAERWLAYQGLGHLAEPKPGSLAVHWRGLDEAAVADLRARITLGWSALARSHSLAILEFDGGIELRLPDRDKGSAVRAILREIGSDVPVAFLGDDRSDETAFRALKHRGFTVLVRERRRRTLAQVRLRPPKELLEFLRRWRDATAKCQVRRRELEQFVQRVPVTYRDSATCEERE
jgi:trehalose 6-phosphate phosphatase